MKIVHRPCKQPGRRIANTYQRSGKRERKSSPIPKAIIFVLLFAFCMFWGYQIASLTYSIRFPKEPPSESQEEPVVVEEPIAEIPAPIGTDYFMVRSEVLSLRIPTFHNEIEDLISLPVLENEVIEMPEPQSEEIISEEPPEQEEEIPIEEETPQEEIEDTPAEEVEEPPEEIQAEVMEEPEPDPEPVSFHQDDFNRDSYVMCSSGLTADQIEGMLDDYPGLDGLGEAIYNIEQEYGVNAFYTLGVASLESGFGTSKLARNKNNLFGLTNCSFSTKEDCVAYFGRLMVNYQDKHNVTMTPNGINPRYCESDVWARDVTSLMNQWARKANDLY